VKTPVLKISTRTDATARKYTVRRAGGAYPEEAATGLRFPFRPVGRAVMSGSAGFRRGLDHPIQIVVPRPDWYHRDNGFTSRYEMDISHEPIIDVASKTLAGLTGDVLDLGCGNGALLEKICRSQELLIPYGIDRNGESLDHARELLPRFREHFVKGNFFDPAVWPGPGRYTLAILMAGRLLEATAEDSRRLIATLQARCGQILVYVYPGWSPDPFEELVRRAGLSINGGHREYAGWSRQSIRRGAPSVGWMMRRQ
jgi:SAM-dependent methyltransferase